MYWESIEKALPPDNGVLVVGYHLPTRRAVIGAGAWIRHYANSYTHWLQLTDPVSQGIKDADRGELEIALEALEEIATDRRQSYLGKIASEALDKIRRIGEQV